jgi:general secretion pathway protein L
VNRFTQWFPFAFPDGKSFFIWWKSELAFLVPPLLRRWWNWRQRRLLVWVEGKEVVLWLDNSGKGRLAGRFQLDEANPAALQDTLTQCGATDVEKVLFLPLARVMRRSVTLPAAAREHFVQVIGYELDHYTPFKANLLYYDARLVAGEVPGVSVRVEFVAVLREELNALLDRLDNIGLSPDCVDVAPHAGAGANRLSGLNLLPASYRERGGRLPRILTIVFAALLSILLVAVGALPTVLDNSFLDALRGEEHRLNQVGKTVENLREQVLNLQRAAAFVLDRKIRNPSALAVLQDISQRLPDDVWVASLQIRDRRVEMQGQAASASALIALLEASPYINNTAFLSPVTPDPASGQERFRLGADLVAPEGSDGYRRVASGGAEDEAGEEGEADEEPDAPETGTAGEEDDDAS